MADNVNRRRANNTMAKKKQNTSNDIQTLHKKN